MRNSPNKFQAMLLLGSIFLLPLLNKENGAAFGQTTNTWSQKTNFGGTARYGGGGFSIGTKGYMGLGNDGSLKNDFWEYDQATDAWTQKANFAGAARYYPVGFSIGSKGYMGTGSTGTAQSDFYEYDPALNTWTAKASMPAAREGAVGFNIGSKGYVGTGINSTTLADFYEFDPVLNTWTAKANFPGAARRLAVGLSIGSNGYIGTGLSASTTDLGDFWEYNPGTNTWAAKAAFPGVARFVASAFSLGSKGYVGVGRTIAGSYQSDFYEYDPATNTWVAKAAYGGGQRAYAVGFTMGTKGYICTGYQPSYSNQFWEYTGSPGATLNFDGVNDNVTIGNSMNTVLDPLNKITVEAWVKPSNNTYLGVIIGNYGNSSGAMQFLLRRDGDQFAFWVDDGGGFEVVNSGVATSTVGIWQHVAGVWDGSKIMVYINGVLKATTTGVTGTSFATTSNLVKIGSNNLTTPEIFTGNIDEVRIWTIARSQCDINTYKDCEIATTATGLLANYHFNQGFDAVANPTETSLTDASGNSYTGTLSGFALTGTVSNWIMPGGVNTGSTTTLPAPVVTASPGNTTICNGQTAILTAAGASTFTWTGGITNSVAFTPTSTISYTVTGTSAVGCTNTAVSTVSVNTCTAAAALHFDGVNDYVNCGNIMPSTYTKEAWIKLENLSLVNNVISGGAADGRHALYLPSSAGNNYLSSGHNGNWNMVQDPTPVMANTWYHVAVTYDAATTTMKLYKNGILVSSNSSVAAFTAGNALRIGAFDNASNLLQGSIDEARVWNVVRSQCEINTYMNCEIPSTASGLIINYHFNQGFSGVANTGLTSLTDASAGANTGTLTNFALTGSTSNWIAPGGVITGSVTPASLIPTVGATVSNSVICYGATTTLNGSGANTYTWTGGVTNGMPFSPSATQSYSVSGTNTLTGCTSTNSAVQGITVNPLPVVTASITNSVICDGAATTLNAGGADTYSWSGGVTDGTPFFPTSTSSYSVNGTNTLTGCTSTNSASRGVTVNPLPVVTASTTNSIICNGETTILNGGGADIYTWSGGVTDGTPFSPTSTLSYSVTGTNTLTGCTSTNSAVQGVTVNALPVISVNSGSVCKGQSFTLLPSGASTYTYSGGSSVVTPTITSSYSVTGTGSNGCVSSVAAVSDVTVHTLPVITVNSGAICNGQSFTMTATGANTYTFSSGSPIVTPSVTSSYSVTGTDLMGCVSSTAAVSGVTVNALPVVTANTTNSIICNGETTILNGGGANTYTWSGGVTNGTSFSPTSTLSYSVTGTNTLTGCTSTNSAIQGVTVNALPVISVNSGSVCKGQSFTMLPSGANTYTYSGGSSVVTPTSTSSYSVTGTGTNGCVSSVAAVSNVTVHALPVITVNSGTICNGQSFTMTATGANTYTFSSGSPIVTPSVTSSYSVTGTDLIGCASSTAAVSGVTVNPLPAVTASISNSAICEGSGTTLNGGGADTYTWTGGVTDGVAFTPLISGSYSVTGTNTLTGCTNTAVESVTVNTLPFVTASISNSVICEGSGTTLNGGGADTYTWTGGVTDGVAFTPTATGTYSVTGTNTLTGCTSTNVAVESVTVNLNPVISAPNGAVCGGGSFTITPAGANTYTISGGSYVVSPSVTTSYSITGTSPEGCTGNAAIVTVSVQLSLTVSITGASSVCDGQVISLTASGANTYSWNTGATSNTITPAPSVNTTYSVIGSSGSCSDSALVLITVNANPTITAISSVSLICAGETVSLTADGAMTYTWNTSSTGATIIDSPTITTTYSVTGEDTNGCTDTAMVVQNVSPCTGFEAFSSVELTRVYPNPGNGLATVELYSEAQLVVTNVIGELISNEKLPEGNHQLDISGFANGIYFVKVIQGERQLTVKLIKE